MNSDNDITHLIERLEAFEERCGIRLEALFAFIDGGAPIILRVNGELHPREGTKLQKSIRLRVDAYDTAGRLVATESESFDCDDFFGFQSFSILHIGCPTERISKIRVYPNFS